MGRTTSLAPLQFVVAFIGMEIINVGLVVVLVATAFGLVINI